MFMREVAGLTLPATVAGHPALELCNTFVGWDEPETGDYLQTYEHLAVLADDLGVVPPGRLPDMQRVSAREQQTALGAAKRLREDLFRVLTAATPDDQHTEGVRRAVADAMRAADLVRGDDGRLAWRPAPSPSLAVNGFALAAADLLAGGAGGVRRCPGLKCGWLFQDTSGRRRWCIMAVCGNRAKARAHAERARAAHEPVPG